MVAHPRKRTFRALAGGTGSTGRALAGGTGSTARALAGGTGSTTRALARATGSTAASLRTKPARRPPRALGVKHRTAIARRGAVKRRPARQAARVAKFLVQHARDAPFVRKGLRSFWEYRDLGISEATGGRYGGYIVRSNHAGNESTGIHFHRPDVQLIYVLKGWLKAEYRGQGTVTLEAGTMLHNPPGNPHNVFAYSEDLEFLEITAPADYPTVDVESVAGPLRIRR